MEKRQSDSGTIAENYVVALVDDDKNILTSVSIALNAEGFTPRVFSDGDTALESLLQDPPNIAVFDIKMPKMDGLELLRRLRQKSSLPVIFLTSKDDEIDEEIGLELGADDYLSKPFSLRLLIARIRAILRRSASITSDGSDTKDVTNTLGSKLIRGRLTMDNGRHKVFWNGQTVSLTVTEFLILEALALDAGVIKSRQQLLEAAYTEDVFVDDRTVDSHIKRMRRKFRQIDPFFDAIATLYSAGYSFNDG